ncbi:hypothetical protein MTO96_039156 [Rhipicephalus appendiculatus]
MATRIQARFGALESARLIRVYFVSTRSLRSVFYPRRWARNRLTSRSAVPSALITNGTVSRKDARGLRWDPLGAGVQGGAVFEGDPPRCGALFEEALVSDEANRSSGEDGSVIWGVTAFSGDDGPEYGALDAGHLQRKRQTPRRNNNGADKGGTLETRSPGAMGDAEQQKKIKGWKEGKDVEAEASEKTTTAARPLLDCSQSRKRSNCHPGVAATTRQIARRPCGPAPLRRRLNSATAGLRGPLAAIVDWPSWDRTRCAPASEA